MSKILAFFTSYWHLEMMYDIASFAKKKKMFGPSNIHIAAMLNPSTLGIQQAAP